MLLFCSSQPHGPTFAQRWGGEEPGRDPPCSGCASQRASGVVDRCRSSGISGGSRKARAAARAGQIAPEARSHPGKDSPRSGCVQSRTGSPPFVDVVHAPSVNAGMAGDESHSPEPRARVPKAHGSSVPLPLVAASQRCAGPMVRRSSSAAGHRSLPSSRGRRRRTVRPLPDRYTQPIWRGDERSAQPRRDAQCPNTGPRSCLDDRPLKSPIGIQRRDDGPNQRHRPANVPSADTCWQRQLRAVVSRDGSMS